MGRDLDFTDQGVANFFEGTAGGTNKIGVRAPATVAADFDIELLAALPGGTEFLQIDTAGQITTTATAGGSLDVAYNLGSVVTVDAGAIAFNSTAANGDVALDVTQADDFGAVTITKSATGAGSGIKVTNAGTGEGVEVIQNGTAIGVKVTQNAVIDAMKIIQAQDAIGLFVFKSAVGTGDVLRVQNLGTGNGIVVDQDGDGIALNVAIDAASTMTGLNVVNSGTGVGAVITQNGAAAAVNITQTTNNNGVFIHKTASGTGDALTVENDGSGAGIFIDSDGNGIALKITTFFGSQDAIQILNGGTGKSLVINQTGSDIAVSIAQTPNLDVLFLDKQGTGSGDVIEAKNAGTGRGLFLDQNANGIALDIDSEATGQPLINLAPVTGNTRGDIAFGTARTASPTTPSEGDMWYDALSERILVKNSSSIITGFGARVSGSDFGVGVLHTIATGAVTLTSSNVLLRAEGGPGVDTLDTLTAPADIRDGDSILVRAESTNTITLGDGTGNMKLNGSNVVLDTLRDNVIFFWEGTSSQWAEISRATSVT